MMIRNKRGISIMIGYVLLITVTMVISGIVYQWVKTYVPAEKADCPDGVSVFLKETVYDCTNKELTLTLKNNGRFNIAGYLIHGTINVSQELASEDLSEYTPLGEGKKAVLLPTLDNSMKPNDEINNVFNLNSTSFNQIYSIDIIPIRFQDKKRVNCAEGRVKETLTCYVAGSGSTCTPNTCLDLGYVCGSFSDGCGGTLDCGTCSSGFSCDASGQCISDSCTPAADPSLSGICGVENCGVATNTNGTCGTVDCGTCDS
jgi:hypothetical protein|tara:strand:+ start:7770 stop:8546 length:777 start_codon:yes stop_codon:yes gene_type:complete